MRIKKINLKNFKRFTKVYPYVLKGLITSRVNQVWATDITYVPMKKGFMYLCAIIDLHTRYVVNWSISNSGDSRVVYRSIGAGHRGAW